jgi:hypothetical protein
MKISAFVRANARPNSLAGKRAVRLALPIVLTSLIASSAFAQTNTTNTDNGVGSLQLKIDDGRAHGYFGVGVLGGPVVGALGGQGQFHTQGDAQAALMFTLTGGVIIGPHRISGELSPFTYFPYPGNGGPTFQINAAYHFMIKMYDSPYVSLFFPIGAGLGFFTGNTASNVYVEGRLDLIGAALRLGRIVIDVNFPSFRYGATRQQGGVCPPPQNLPDVCVTTNVDAFTWLFGTTISYVF